MHLGVNLRKAFLDGIRCIACTDSDGSADSMIEDISQELQKLRDTLAQTAVYNSSLTHAVSVIST